MLNALQFVPEGRQAGNSDMTPGSCLRISVSDDGPGVPASDPRSAYSIPSSAGAKGASAWVSPIVQQIVQAHGGEIAVGESAWGGAAFNMRFPLTQGAVR